MGRVGQVEVRQAVVDHVHRHAGHGRMPQLAIAPMQCAIVHHGSDQAMRLRTARAPMRIPARSTARWASSSTTNTVRSGASPRCARHSARNMAMNVSSSDWQAGRGGVHQQTHGLAASTVGARQRGVQEGATRIGVDFDQARAVGAEVEVVAHEHAGRAEGMPRNLWCTATSLRPARQAGPSHGPAPPPPVPRHRAWPGPETPRFARTGAGAWWPAAAPARPAAGCIPAGRATPGVQRAAHATQVERIGKIHGVALSRCCTGGACAAHLTRRAFTAVLGQVGQQRVHPDKAGAVDQVAPARLAGHQPGMGQLLQVERQRAGRHVQLLWPWRRASGPRARPPPGLERPAGAAAWASAASDRTVVASSTVIVSIFQ
jgi:hypothetical protein